ncbi:transposase [Streptomyces sp. NPDC056653]|uniref:transposase n=1 Tax=Streptomyces sp. NPDC056653 TaxID=3345894 RepID=UPI0036BD4DE9
MTDGYGIPLGRVLTSANRHDSPLLAPTLDRLNDLGPLPDNVTVHLDAGYDSDKTRTLLNERGLHGRIAHIGEKGTHPGQSALARGAHPRLAERLPPARPLLRAARHRRRRILRPHRHDHHRAQPDPAALDNSPLGRTPEPPTMTAPLSAPPLSLIFKGAARPRRV